MQHADDLGEVGAGRVQFGVLAAFEVEEPPEQLGVSVVAVDVDGVHESAPVRVAEPFELADILLILPLR